jgi:hypothetical protein
MRARGFGHDRARAQARSYAEGENSMKSRNPMKTMHAKGFSSLPALLLAFSMLAGCGGEDPVRTDARPPDVAGAGAEAPDDAGALRPWPDNPAYWQRDGRPLLLAGGSATDHLFIGDIASSDGARTENVRAHLDAIAAAGGNYVRNVMSQRASDPDWRPHLHLGGGRFDLDRWNPAYWRRFEEFLAWTHELGMVVQIELWDPWDFSGAASVHWPGSAWRPANNVNYDADQSGLPDEWEHAPWMRQPSGRREHPFFWTVPGLYNDNPAILRRQEAFVDKVLSYALRYPHVLYCIDNEFSGDARWTRYWARYVRERARSQGRTIQVCELWTRHQMETGRFPNRYELPDVLDFYDISQVNHLFGQEHYDRVLAIHRHLQAAGQERPLTSTKIYKAGDPGVRSFWRHLAAGTGAVRFHRYIRRASDGAGNGFNEAAQASLAALRKLQTRVEPWALQPRNDLLRARDDDEAYLAARPGEAYFLYFTDGGEVGLDLAGHAQPFEVRWIDVARGAWGGTETLAGGAVRTLRAPGAGGWVAAIVAADR